MKGGRKRGRETSMCGCLSRGLHWGRGLQPRHVPWPGIQPATLWFAACTPSTEPHQPGLKNYLNVCVHIFCFFLFFICFFAFLFLPFLLLFIFSSTWDFHHTKISCLGVWNRPGWSPHSLVPRFSRSFIHSLSVACVWSARVGKQDTALLLLRDSGRKTDHLNRMLSKCLVRASKECCGRDPNSAQEGQESSPLSRWTGPRGAAQVWALSWKLHFVTLLSSTLGWTASQYLRTSLMRLVVLIYRILKKCYIMKSVNIWTICIHNVFQCIMLQNLAGSKMQSECRIGI